MSTPRLIRYTPSSLMAVDIAMYPAPLYGRLPFEALDERACDVLVQAAWAAEQGRPEEAAVIARHGMSTIRALRLELAETLRDTRGVR